MTHHHDTQPTKISVYIWIVGIACIVFIVVLAIIGLRSWRKKAEARKQRQIAARQDDDKIFGGIIQNTLTLTVPKPPHPPRPVRQRSLAQPM